MKVYRYLCEAELNKILNGDMERVGTIYGNQNASNTHNYKPNTPYMHFFAKLTDLEKIRDLKAFEPQNFYIALFDIPVTKLLLHTGKGFYPTSGYDVDYDSVREFAVPSSDVKAEHLKFYMKDENRGLSPQDVKYYIKKSKENNCFLDESSKPQSSDTAENEGNINSNVVNKLEDISPEQ